MRTLYNPDAMTMIARIIVLLICFPVHECAHAWTADRLGDPTGRNRGRITLNPFKHLDFMGTVMILLIGVGYAKPVPVNINRFKHKKRDFALTALAGPVSNLLMAVIFLLVLRFFPNASVTGDLVYTLRYLFICSAYINISLAVFNLIPIPPLDGSRVLMAALPDGAYNSMLRRERYIMGVLLLSFLALSRLGLSPVGFLTRSVYDFLYRLIVL